MHRIGQAQAQNDGGRHGCQGINRGIDDGLDKASVLGHLNEVVKTAEFHVFCQMLQLLDLQEVKIKEGQDQCQEKGERHEQDKTRQSRGDERITGNVFFRLQSIVFLSKHNYYLFHP